MESLEQLLELLSGSGPHVALLTTSEMVQSAKTELNNHMVDYEKLKKEADNQLSYKIESDALNILKRISEKSVPFSVELTGGDLFNEAYVSDLVIKHKNEIESLNDKIESIENEVESTKGKITEFKDVAKHSSSMCVEIGGYHLFNMAHVEMIASNDSKIKEENKALKEKVVGLTEQIEAMKALKYKKPTQNEYEKLAANQYDESKLDEARNLEIKELAKSLLIAGFTVFDTNRTQQSNEAIKAAQSFMNEWEAYLAVKND